MRSYIAVRLSVVRHQVIRLHEDAHVMRVQAQEELTFKSADGVQSVHIEAGAIFYLARSESLGSDIAYVVTERMYGNWRCWCPACRPGCKHERAVQEHNDSLHTLEQQYAQEAANRAAYVAMFDPCGLAA